MSDLYGRGVTENARNRQIADNVKMQEQQQMGRNQALAEVEQRLIQQAQEQAAQQEIDRKLQLAADQYNAKRYAPGYNPSVGEMVSNVGNYLRNGYNTVSDKVSAFLDSAAESVGRSEYPAPKDKGGM